MNDNEAPFHVLFPLICLFVSHVSLLSFSHYCKTQMKLSYEKL